MSFKLLPKCPAVTLASFIRILVGHNFCGEIVDRRYHKQAGTYFLEQLINKHEFDLPTESLSFLHNLLNFDEHH
jgi:hypothetical protein